MESSSKEKQIDELYNDVNEIFDEEYREHRHLTAYHTAKHLYERGYRKQSEWISVDERLPETDNENRYTFNVLVFIPQREGCRQHGMYLGKIRRVKASDGKDNFWNIPTKECEWTVWGWSYFEHPVVTHWMPLPEAPKMKGGAE